MSGNPARRALLFRLRLLQLRLWLELLLRSTTRGLCFGLAIALGGALALVAQAGVVERSNLVLAALGGLAIGALWGLIRPPSLLRTARTADDRAGLEARTGTAVELLRHPSGRLAEAQLADAARTLKAARGGWPLPPMVVWREALLTLVMIGTLLGLLRLEGQGASLLTSLPVGQPEAAADVGEREALANPTPAAVAAADAAGQQPQAGKPSATLRTLDELRRARESGALSPEEADAMLNQVESELNQRSAEARGQRQTLDRLARALSQVSAGEEAAESIQEGDLGQAADQLRQLGREADQLSQDAKNQLAQALRRAATESPRSSPLTDRERRAADALAGRDYQAQQAALAALGDELARAAGQTPSESDVAAAAERLQAERDAAQQASGAAGQQAQAQGAAGQQAAAAAQGGQPQNSQGGQAGGSQAGQGEGSGRGSGGGQGNGPGEGQAAPAQPENGPAERSSPLDLGQAAPRLDVAGKQVEVPARPGSDGRPTGRTEQANGDDGQVVDRNDTTFDSPALAAPVQAGGQSERIIVPGDQRQVVRDYFARRTGKANP